jgi:hypothetical protein
MSHTLHRRGSEEDLKYDFPVLAMGAQGINRDGIAPKLGKIVDIMSKHHPVFYSCPPKGNSLTVSHDEMVNGAKDNSVAHAVFKSEEDLVALLKDLKDADLGVSVTVSGLFDHVHECCRKVGLEPHTVNTSLGIYGRTEMLPQEKILEISTMCGHGMVSFALIKTCVEEIKSGAKTPHEAAMQLAPNCICGIFNIDRAERILMRLSQE